VSLWVVVACGQVKRGRPGMASQVYTSSLFRCALRWAQSVAPPGRVLILSARHGLIEPTRYVAPYEVSFGNPRHGRRAVGQAISAQHLARQVAERGLSGRVICVGGEVYVQRLRAAGCDAADPFGDLLRAEGHHHSGAGRLQSALRRWHGRIPERTAA